MKDLEKRISLYVKEHADWAIFNYKGWKNLPNEKLVFVSTAHLAHMRHCPLDALFRMKKMEDEMFYVYAYDRIYYSKLTGKIRTLPKLAGSCYMEGDDVKRKDIEYLLKTKYIIKDTDNIRSNNLSGSSQSPMFDGRKAHNSIAEQYPTIRWNYNWKKYVVIGEPDGITDDFVYEFKTTGKRFYLKNVLPVAFAQAGIYGYFFKRKNKRVQVYIKDEKITETYELPVDVDNAINTLMLLDSTDKGLLPSLPEKWKCRCCDYLMTCPLHPECY